MSVVKSVFVGVAGALAVTVAIAAESGSLPVTKLKFFETGIGPLKAAAAFGDLQKGAHGTYIRLRHPAPSAFRRLLRRGHFRRRRQRSARCSRCRTSGRLLLVPKGQGSPRDEVRLG